MKSRQTLVALLLAVPALVAGVLVAAPTEAVSRSGVQLISVSVAVAKANGAGNRAGKVRLGCSFKRTTCVGKLRLLPELDTDGAVWVAYRVPAGKTAYATVYHWKDQTPVTTVKARPHRKVQFKQGGQAPNYNKWIYVEPKVSVRLGGTVTGPGTDLSDTTRIKNVSVTLRDWNGRTSNELKTVNVNQSNGAYSIGTFALGTNNASTKTYRLSITAYVKDFTSQQWKFRQWYWRGSTTGKGAAYGGSRYVAGSNGVKMAKYNETGFRANFSFGKIEGTVTGPSDKAQGADIRIAAPPRTMPLGTDLRELDVPYCADDFATTRTDGAGNYEQTFLPASESADRRYLVKVSSTRSSTGMRLWNGIYRGCLHARDYASSTANLRIVPANGTLTMPPFNIQSSTAELRCHLEFPGFTGKPSDLRMTLREYLPYKKILDSPIVADTTAGGNGNYTFTNVSRGRYWIESGRRTSCSSWYPSLYPDNGLYLQGADRGAERWKTVNGYREEYQKSVDMGYVRRTPPSGYRGWMYRGACIQHGAGAIINTSVTTANAFNSAVHPAKDATVREGATVSGHISRIGGKTNKEMLVSIYSTQGTLVMRTAYSGRSGNFTVRGLASGNYNIMLNADSWRGIGRTFTGRHKIRVSAGNSHRVGTLDARF